MFLLLETNQSIVVNYHCHPVECEVEHTRLTRTAVTWLFVVVLIYICMYIFIHTCILYTSPWPKLPRLLEFTGVKWSVRQMTTVSGSFGLTPLFCCRNQSDGLENPAQREPLSRSSRKVTLVSAVPWSTAAAAACGAPPPPPPPVSTECTSTARHMYTCTRWCCCSNDGASSFLFDTSRASREKKQALIRRHANY